ncbi:MAG: DUF1972 domain-containing protein [Bacteroidota bacterium]
MKKKQVAVIGTAGLPAKYAGFETLAAHLVDNLSNQWDFTVYCSGRQYKKTMRPKTYKGAKLNYLPLQADGLQGVAYDVISMIHALFYADILLILGVSGSFLVPFVRLFTNKKIITSVDSYGWKKNKWGSAAMLYRSLGEWIAIKFAHVNITNRESMEDYTALRYNDRVVSLQKEVNSVQITKYKFMGRPYAFKLCRIAPENNIEMILGSFVQTPQHQLVISGNWNKSEYGKSLRKAYAIFPNIHILDPIYDQNELDMLRGNSFAYIHGNQPGGIDAALLEAMFMGLPVLSLGTAGNKITTEGKALYFSSADELAILLNHTRIGEFQRVGRAMQETAQRRYTWQMVATKYAYLFMRTLKNNKTEKSTYQPAKLSALSFDMGY